MLVPVRWLKEFVPTELSTEEIAERLTLAGLEAENITRIGAEWDRIYVGVVERVEPHPNADRLVLATVAAGEHVQTVVTGAPNIAAGQKVALALVGAKLVDPYSEEPRTFALKAAPIRGVRSEGMVCSEKELGLSEEHEGIMVLPDDAPVGVPLREYLGDDVIEFEITPNLVHAFSVYGIARELAAVIAQPLRQPELADLDNVPRDTGLVEIRDETLCPRYVGVVIEGVTVGPSPEWMQRRLTRAGMRPINNIVDLTNYVMAEIGQPMHAFDRDTLREGRIVVRIPLPGERLTTLDHVERELDEQMLVIADAERAVALAGVIGGEETEVSERTTTVLLESASFDRKSIRRTSRTLKLRTEASARFDRGVDPNLAMTAVMRFVKLLGEIMPEARVTALADVYPQPRQRGELEMPYSEIERLLGIVIPLQTVVDILARLDFQPRVVPDDVNPTIVVSVPTYRSDVTLKADLVEEVARIYGYDALPEMLPVGRSTPVRREVPRLVERVAQDALVAAGLQQVITYSMIGDPDLVALSPERDSIPEVLGGYQRPESDYVRATNPMRVDWALMRPTMVPSLLKIVAENRKHAERVAIFETARTYQPEGRDSLPNERRGVAIAMSGVRQPMTWYARDEDELDFYDVKGAIEVLLERLGVAAEFVPVEHPSLQPGRAAAVSVGSMHIGVLGELHPRVAANFDVTGRVAIAEIDLEPFQASLLESWSVEPVSRFQPVRQDFAFIVDETVSAEAVRMTIAAAAQPLAREITLFDIYRGPGVPAGKKSLAFSVTLSARDRQLAEHELERLRTRIEKEVAKRVGGTLRT
jgi:phenylalanyl-tRNA synthetase beta chain